MGRVLLVCVVLLLSACGADGAGAGQQAGAVVSGPLDAATWAELEVRPLALTPLAAGASCPLSSSAMLTGSATGLAFGPGPIYAAPGGPLLVLKAKGSDGRRTAKLLWLADPQYKTGALIRGMRLDATGEVTFEGAKSLRFDSETGLTLGDATQGSSQGWRYLQSTISVPAPGCYGFQIDLVGGKSASIVLKAG